jgi:hypothetical protein
MATWASLTQAQRDEVVQEIAAVREWSGMAARLHNLGRAIAAKWSGNVETTVASLDAGDIPVYDAGLGQEALSKADLQTLAGYAIDYSVATDGATPSFNTPYHRALYVKAVGIYGTLQQGQG